MSISDKMDTIDIYWQVLACEGTLITGGDNIKFWSIPKLLDEYESTYTITLLHCYIYSNDR